MDSKKLVNLIYIVAGLLVGYIVATITGDIFDYYQLYVKFGFARAIPKVLGLVFAIGLAGAGIYHTKLNNFMSEVVAELKKVTWPTKKETYAATIVVIITLMIMAVILFAFDWIWAKLIGTIIMG